MGQADLSVAGPWRGPRRRTQGITVTDTLQHCSHGHGPVDPCQLQISLRVWPGSGWGPGLKQRWKERGGSFGRNTENSILYLSDWLDTGIAGSRGWHPRSWSGRLRGRKVECLLSGWGLSWTSVAREHQELETISRLFSGRDWAGCRRAVSGCGAHGVDSPESCFHPERLGARCDVLFLRSLVTVITCVS